MSTFNTECSVCLEEFNEESKTTSLPCGHTFHVDCIIKSFRKSNECPNCRDTDGNPKTSTAYNSDFDLFDVVSDDSSVQPDDYQDFIGVIDLILKKNKELKSKLGEFLKLSNRLDRKTSRLEHEFAVGRKEQDKKYLENFKKNNENLKKYNEMYNECNKSKNAVRNIIKKQISELTDIKIDQDMCEYIKCYLDTSSSIFRVPKDRSLYEYVW